MSLELQYQLLIYIFIASLPIHFGNLIIYWGERLGFTVMFSGLMVMAIGLIVHFGNLQAQNRKKNFIQNMLTLGALALVVGSTINLYAHVFGL